MQLVHLFVCIFNHKNRPSNDCVFTENFSVLLSAAITVDLGLLRCCVHHLQRPCMTTLSLLDFANEIKFQWKLMYIDWKSLGLIHFKEVGMQFYRYVRLYIPMIIDNIDGVRLNLPAGSGRSVKCFQRKEV